MTVCIQGYGNTLISSLGTVNCNINIDDVECEVAENVVSDSVQKISLLVGRAFTEQPHVKLIKDYSTLTLIRQLPNVTPDNEVSKVALWADKAMVIPPNHLCNVPIKVKNEYDGDLFWKRVPGLRKIKNAALLKLY